MASKRMISGAQDRRAQSCHAAQTRAAAEAQRPPPTIARQLMIAFHSMR
jgi:hypothetical protein